MFVEYVRRMYSRGKTVEELRRADARNVATGFMEMMD